ncbi:DUF7089 family protein [Halocatena pleomorpha]|uniref:Uncharacterized protein n=1 Tax=Halocatena pleomorpha TaxID=1785090 RepID=A0A3P3R4F7_9EURY|nr:hypothetical protein [Halocatena pleomorpha]RRJ28352.1 hypothetical protein EIK79_16050 [Halocatena pleomorpha]
MFTPRDLSESLAAVRDEHAPEAIVVDASDFQTLPSAQAEDLGLLVNALDPVTHPDDWLPSDCPEQLRAYVGSDFTIGLPGDGGVTWTTQTTPPTVFVKDRTAGSPDSFVEFLIAEALVQAGLGVPEQFIGFFRSEYSTLDAATPLSPADTYQLATALYAAYLGLHTRPIFESWAETVPELHAAWRDAGERLTPRLSGLTSEVATGETSFAAAAELACNALKHGCDLPTPFEALDTAAYRESGPEYAIVWARKTFEELPD